MSDPIQSAAAALGKKGGSAKTPAKAAAVRLNGKKGGRPPFVKVSPELADLIVRLCDAYRATPVLRAGALAGDPRFIKGLRDLLGVRLAPGITLAEFSEAMTWGPSWDSSRHPELHHLAR